ncbi:MAG: glycosyltransferase family 4 protein [Kiritimatiellia bacterium]
MKVLVSNEFYELFRGDKDFLIPRLIAQKLGHDVSILCPTELSLADQNAGFSFSKEGFAERLGLGPDAVKFHSPLRWVRKTHNKQISFLIPLPSYWIQLLNIRPDFIVESVYTTLTPRSFLNWLYCARFRKGRVLLDSGDEGRNRRLLPFERRAIRQARKIFTYSPAGAKRIADKYGIADPDRFFIHLKLLDPERFRFREEFGPPEFTVGYAGRFLRAKGFARFLELARTWSGPTARFRAVGANDDGFELPDSLDRQDYVENARMAEIYSSIDLLVLPDMRNCRGYSTAAQEALMCGAEVAIGCLDRSFYPKTDGVFFFDPDRPGDLADFIAQKARRPRAEMLAARKALAEEYRRAADPAGFLAELARQMEGNA